MCALNREKRVAWTVIPTCLSQRCVYKCMGRELLEVDDTPMYRTTIYKGEIY